MSPNSFKSERGSSGQYAMVFLIAALLIIAIIVAIVAANSGIERTLGSRPETGAISQPADTPAADSINFGDFTAAELSGGVDLDEAACVVKVVITNATDRDAHIAITLDFSSTSTTEETVVPAQTRWEITFTREAPIVALTLTETTGLSDVNLKFTPDYSRCNGEPATNAGGGVGDAQTITQLDQATTTTTVAPV